MSVKVSHNQDPYIINKNLGAPLQIDADDLPGKNADGQAVIELTVEQKYAFDTRGWLLIPEVLGGSELEEMQDFCHRLHHDPESIPEHERTTLGGPVQKLLDHPLVVGLLNEFTAYPPLSSQECYGFSLEGSHLFYRSVGMGWFGPHNGNGLYR